jgi:hypothetical protein
MALAIAACSASARTPPDAPAGGPDAADGDGGPGPDGVTAALDGPALAPEAGAEASAMCGAVAGEAVALVIESQKCQAGDLCDVVVWETLIGRPACTMAMGCWALVPRRKLEGDLAARARALAERSQACGVCGIAGCAAPPVHAACDLGLGRCVATPP